MQRRALVILSLVFIVFFALVVRLGVISVDNAVKSVGVSQGSRTLTVSEVRGTIYDRNMTPLVNASNAYYATLLPDKRLLQRLAGVTDASEYARLLALVEEDTPILAHLNDPAPITEGLRVYMAPTRYENECIAPHLLGYLDGAGTTGVSGIEKAYDTTLKQYSGCITATYPVNGKGKYVDGDDLRIVNTVESCRGGVVLSIDKTIQETVETILMKSLNKGAVVVMDPVSGELLALASYPDFHPMEIAERMQQTDGALMNRALSLYDCGSVFKIVTTLAALEQGVSVEQTFECPGAITVDGTVFHCHRRLGHQRLSMNEAFAESCNVYYIQLAQQIGSEALLDMADRLGLTDDIALADSIVAPSAVLPTAYDLSSPAALANISFGQGRLLISPLHIARMTATVASNGSLPSVMAVLGVVDDQGRWIQSETGGGETVLSAASVSALQHMMELVVSEGTGTRAQPSDHSAAGKTGTAETGQINAGKSVEHSWFTGYFPAQDPKYVVTVLVEDIQENGKTAAEIFCEISNNLK